ncbi:unnamed protein product [Lactuca saligna]|uniref:Uncharacterized protein n=1 Tax=Lactuca saligna TaxID=75948 RepID=A0AA35Y5I9_LACSI|nr:unnamed protein product [Lactuca saligna]
MCVVTYNKDEGIFVFPPTRTVFATLFKIKAGASDLTLPSSRLRWFIPLRHQQTLVRGFFLALNRFLGLIDPPICARSMLIIPRLLRNINNANYLVAKLKMCLFASWVLFVVV